MTYDFTTLGAIAGILMAGASASTTAGATVIDSLPYGSFGI